MNSEKWINTLPNRNEIYEREKNQLNPNIWTDTLPKKKMITLLENILWLL